MNGLANMKAVSLNKTVPFHCQMCGGCCRYLKDSVMLEPMDAYYLARHLRERGEPVEGTEDVLERYAHPAWLTNKFPMFLLNTAGPMDVCVFLKAGRCSVYDARPLVCRMYPFFVGPGSRGRDFQYFLCTEKAHHFTDGMVTVKDWLSQNFTREARAVLKAEYEALPILGQNIRAMGAARFQQLLFQFMFYHYYNYELDEPFQPQFISNLEKLKELTGGPQA